jgi:predicted peptidase
MKKIILLCLATFAFGSLFAQDKSVYEKKYFIRGTDTLPYRILYPINYKANKKYPVVLFLHGAGERGKDNEAQLTHGWKLFADSSNRKKYPAFVIFPQCPQNSSWANVTVNRNVQPYELAFLSAQPMTTPLSLVSQLMDSLLNSGAVVKKKIYIGGLSMGGMGTFDLLWRKPGFFAAGFPICGGGDTAKPAVYGKKFPIWVFHGAADPVVDVKNSQKMVAALKKSGAKVKYSEYLEVKHDSWTNAFAEPDLLSWIFRQKR